MEHKNISMMDIARMSGVSIATVSRVLNKTGRYSAKTEQRVMEVVEQTKYSINPNAQGLRTNRTKTIGVVIPDITNEYFSHIVRAIEAAIMPYEYNVFVLMFMKVAILQQKSKFGYLYKFNAERMANTKIMLPVTDDGAPDYEYMEQYIKNLILRKYKQYLSYLDSKEKTDTVATDN